MTSIGDQADHVNPSEAAALWRYPLSNQGASVLLLRFVC